MINWLFGEEPGRDPCRGHVAPDASWIYMAAFAAEYLIDEFAKRRAQTESDEEIIGSLD